MVPETVSIARRFNGPPNSANGGYACGVAAELLGAPARVTLRRPPPLETALTVARGDERLELHADGHLVAEAEPGHVAVEVPTPVPFDAAEEASSRYLGFERHAFPTCFTCGPRRPHGDGLGIYPGLVDGASVWAAPFVPDASLATSGGSVAAEVVWAALDCPSGIPVVDVTGQVVMLGRLAAERRADVRSDERYVTMGWVTGQEGRKVSSASAIVTEDGEVVAVADATWIVLRDQPVV